MNLTPGQIFYPKFQEPYSTVTAVAFGVCRLSDGYWYDFADGTFKPSDIGTQYQSMSESLNGLWLFPAGWTTPAENNQYHIQFKVTRGTAVDYVTGDPLIVYLTPASAGSTPSTTPPTTQELYDAVNIAISNRLSGTAVQSYSGPEGINLQYHSLNQLRELRDQLRRELNSGGRRVVYGEIHFS